jgi:hypothetical protein
LGDEADHYRDWGKEGCWEGLSVRSGTLLVSVRVRLAAGPLTADCATTTEQPIVAMANAVLDGLSAYRTFGQAVDDPARRAQAVRRIESGELRPKANSIVTLPPDLADLSDLGQVVARHHGKTWVIVFFEVSGILGHYSGWVYAPQDDLTSDPLGSHHTPVITSISPSWSYIVV